MNNTFVIGKFVAHHAVRGELKIYPYTEHPEILNETGYLLCDSKRYEVEKSRVHKNMIIVKLKGFDHIESSLFLIGKEVEVFREDVEDDGEGHYIVDLIGLSVYQKDRYLGRIKDVLTYTEQDLFEVEREDGGVFLIPVVDEFIKSIDLARSRVDVELIDGLMELND